MNISRSALLPYSAAQMYAVVADVRAYPSFLNWCSKVELLEEEEMEVVAKMHIAYGKLAFAFTTRNTNEIDKQIELNLVDGPFSNFQGCWRFIPLQGDASSAGCKVTLDMNFNFERGVVSAVLGKMFEKIAATQIDAFQQQAHQLYEPL